MRPDEETICGIGNQKNSYFQEHLKDHGISPFKSSVDFVTKQRAKGIPVGIISASRNARAVMKAAGLSELFDAVVDGIDSARLGIKGKPEPDIFLVAAGKLGTIPARTAVFEDALAGIEAGKAGGFSPVIGVDRYEREPEMKDRGADLIVKDLSEIILIEKTGIEAARLPSAMKARSGSSTGKRYRRTSGIMSNGLRTARPSAGWFTPGCWRGRNGRPPGACC